MLHVCVKKFDVTSTVANFLAAKTATGFSFPNFSPSLIAIPCLVTTQELWQTRQRCLSPHDTRCPLPQPRPMLHQAVIGIAATFLGMATRPWCFQEGATLSQVSTLMATSKQPSLGAWRAVQPWFDLVGYGASMRPSPVSPLVPLQHLISRT